MRCCPGYFLIFSGWLAVLTTTQALAANPVSFEEDKPIKYFFSAGVSRQFQQEDHLFSSHSSDSVANSTFRLLVDSPVSENSRFKLNILQSLKATTGLFPSANYPNDQYGRSALFSWEQFNSNDRNGQLTADIFNMQWQTKFADITLGRQPINLATTFYFTANDSFVPFAPQAFFREYKPGVDALRAEISVDDLSQLTLLAVLAYDYQPDRQQFNNGPKWSDTSLLAIFKKDISTLEWGILGGTLNKYTIMGGSLQTEFYDWLGFRAEGHLGVAETSNLDDYCQWVAGIEHYHDNGLFWRFEYLYNEKGYKDTNLAYQSLLAGNFSGRYLGKQYGAFGVSYEITPLLASSVMAMTNLNDHSFLYSVNLVYSTSDESEISMTLTVPEGAMAKQTDLGSEFGSLPTSIGVEYRVYF